MFDEVEKFFSAFLGLTQNLLKKWSVSSFLLHESISVPSSMSALAKKQRPKMVVNSYEGTSNQWMNRTIIHPVVGPVMLWWGNSSDSSSGCIIACYPFR